MPFSCPSSTKEIHHNEVQNDVGEDKIGKCSLGTNSGKLGLVGGINLEIRIRVIFTITTVKLKTNLESEANCENK